MNIKAIKSLPGHYERRTKNEERRTGGRQSAFTLIELLITIVLVGIVLLALIMNFHESLKSMERQKDLLSASLLSEDLMNEIRSRQYVQSPPSGGTNNRVDFNDVDDYTNWSETPPKTIEGVILSNYIGFTRRVFVVNVSNVSDWAAPTTNTTDFKRITVVISNTAFAVSNMSVVSRYDLAD
ncbi:MAG: type II secretion system GspH family protein [Kiritimatiellae bacterium]|nr:type II secretion system GspH family protein [Kiritimatiellia bacterium]